MKLRIQHRTRYEYAAPVRQNINEARLQPHDLPEQRRMHFRLRIDPQTSAHDQRDFYGNDVHFFEIAEPHRELVVEAESEVETRDAPRLPPDGPGTPLSALQPSLLPYDIFDYTTDSTYVAGFHAFAEEAALAIADAGGDAWRAARAIMAHVHGTFEYHPGVTNSATTLAQALNLRRGVCQDFAHAMIGLCRAAGIPARYVSGYIYNGPRDRLKGAQATHAWVEAWLPTLGWIGLDPTNDTPTDGRYIKAAVGRDYADAAPLKGTYRGTAQRSLGVDVMVTRLD